MFTEKKQFPKSGERFTIRGSCLHKGKYPPFARHASCLFSNTATFESHDAPCCIVWAFRIFGSWIRTVLHIACLIFPGYFARRWGCQGAFGMEISRLAKPLPRIQLLRQTKCALASKWFKMHIAEFSLSSAKWSFVFLARTCLRPHCCFAACVSTFPHVRWVKWLSRWNVSGCEFLGDRLTCEIWFDVYCR